MAATYSCAPPHRGGAPQHKRLKKRHEPIPLKTTFAERQFAAGAPSVQVTSIAQSKSRHPPKADTLCRFCGAAGCSRKRCPKVACFGSRFLSAQMFLSTVQQLKSIPILFESLPILEEVRDGSIMSVDDSWKTGKEFRHIVLTTWLRSSMPQHSQEVFLAIRRVKRNLLWLDPQELGVVVHANELYDKYLKYKLAQKSLSKLIVVKGLYINAN